MKPSEQLAAIESYFEYAAPDNDRDVLVHPANLFSYRIYEWDYEEHGHTQAEKDEYVWQTGQVNDDGSVVLFPIKRGS